MRSDSGYALRIDGLRKTYAGGLQALRGIDLKVREGDFFGLLGPNGAGKSTTIGIVSSLVRKTAGSVKVFGVDADKQPFRAKSFLGIVPQEVNFSQFESCIDIVLNQAGYYGIRRRTAMRGAEEYLRKLGLWNKRNDISRTLSGGFKRRLMIARALVHKPRMLILDEPTAGVDVELRRSMWSFLRELNAAGTTIVLTTHYLEEAESLCKNIAIISEGIIVEDASMKQMLAKLHVETFVLDLAAPIQTVPRIPHFQLRLVDPQTMEVDMRKGQNLNLLFAQLSDLGLDVRSMRNKANRLEELFIRLVDAGTANTGQN